VTRWGAREGVAGLLAAAALFLGFFELAYRPFRVAPVALVIALIATVMSREQQRLVGLAVAVIGICFVAGAAIAVLTKHPLY
jgi:membrane-bound ClpP family serine protease